jgi:serine/threonine-protein kinase
MNLPTVLTRDWRKLVMTGVLALIFVVGLPAQALPQIDIKNAVKLTSDIVRKGMRLLPIPLVEISLSNIQIEFNMGIKGGSFDTSSGPGELRLLDIKARLGSEDNEILKQQLETMRQHLEADIQRNRLLAEQNQTIRNMLDHQIKAFKYQQQKDESLLRKLRYDVPADELVVVVADFSSGNPDQGQEIANEIAYHLAELKKHGINIHVLTGEIKPGVVIRSEDMARDIGQHFPPQTNYVIVWGTMSPRTVGRYRPHLTCVQKTGQESGVSVSFDIDLESQTLPLPSDPPAYQRECYERLIGVTCAAIPSCFAAHEISRDRTPDLSRFYSFIGSDCEEAAKLQKELAPLTRWTQTKNANRLGFIRRLAGLSPKNPFPSTIVNEKDDSVMVLLTDTTGAAKRFPSKDAHKDTIIYIDIVETTNRQFANFLNARGGNQEQGGAAWLKLEEFTDIDEANKRFVVKEKRDADSPVINVSWFAAGAYCDWAGKELPNQDEWRLAGSAMGEGEYPWGKGFDSAAPLCSSGLQEKAQNRRGGSFPKDKSRIGCFDMAGNVAEWCHDWYDESKGQKVVCGGSFRDKNSAQFTVATRRGVPPVKHTDWVGFRGVMRVVVDKTQP